MAKSINTPGDFDGIMTDHPGDNKVRTVAPTQTAAITAVLDNVDPVQGSVAAGGRTNDPTPTISGTISTALNPGERLVLYNGTTALIDATVDNTTLTWTATPTLGSNGRYSIIARVVDQAGNQGPASVVRKLTFDTLAPLQTASITDISDNVGSVRGVIANGGMTNDFKPTINGTLSAALAFGEVVTIYRNGVAVGKAKVNATTKTWSFTPTLTSDGSYIFSASVVDAAGNQGPLSSAYTITLDTVAPTQTAVITAVLDNVDPVQGSVAAGGRTNDPTPTISGTISTALNPGERLVLYNGTTALIDATVDNTTLTWTATPTLGSNGSYSITARVVDQAGNQGAASRVRKFSLDNLAPTISISSDKGTLKAGETANITFSFSKDPGRTFSWDGNSGDINVTGGMLSALSGSGLTRTANFTPTAGSSGTASITVASGSYTDAAGNTGAGGSSMPISYDTLAPTLSISSSASTLKAGETATITFTFSEVPSGFTASDITTSGGSLSGLAVSADPKVYTANFSPTAGSSGTASITVAAGTYTDAAGNSATEPADVRLSFDTVVASLSAALASSSDTGVIGDGITALARVGLTGQAQGGAKVALRGTTQQTRIGADGQFVLPEVQLSSGENLLVLELLDESNRVLANRELRINQETPGGSTPTPDPVLAWNRLALEAIRRDASVPSVATRALAMQSIAVLDTLAAIDGTPAFLVGLAAPAGIPVGAAVGAAAARVLSHLFPAQATNFLNQQNTDLAIYTDDAARQAAVAFGQAVADAVIALREQDGWDAFVVENEGSAPGQWRPTPPAFDLPQTPQWSLLTPFALQKGSQFRPSAPPELSSTAYTEALKEVQRLGSATSSERTAEQTLIARFWADGVGTYTPPGHWNQIANDLAAAEGYGYGSAARLLAILNVALADASIAAWDTKYSYDFWRPITAIRNAEDDGNPDTEADPSWQPLLLTPNHPEYVSGHSTYSGAAAVVLDQYLGEQAFSTTSVSLPNVTRSYGSFQEAAAEAGRSRIYGGIHYDFSNQAGQALGADVANWVVDAFRTDVDLRGPQLALEQRGGLVLRQAPRLSGFALDNISGVASLSVTLAGRDPQLLNVDGRGRFSLDVGSVFGPLADGAYGLSFQAVDGAGNRSQPLAYGFQLDTTAPTLEITGLTDGDELVQGVRLCGIADGTGSALQALSYRFNDGVARPLVFDPSNGGFEVPLDLSDLGPGIQMLTVTARDGAGLGSSRSLSLQLTQSIPLTIEAVSPADGSGEVGATFRPEVRFSRAVDPASLTNDSFWATDAAGKRLGASIVVAPQGTRAWLLFDQALPGSSRINLQLNGDRIRAAGDGQLLDADANGTPGGNWSSAFSTVNLTPVAGTTLIGKVVGPGADLKPNTFDDFRAGPDGAAHTADDLFLEPLAGVKVFILGLEDRAVLTDAQGRFELKDVPVGVVKVAVDGRTATNPPTDVFYPEMVMDVTIRPAQVNTIMGTMGTTQEQLENFSRTEVYLPRISTKVLTAISPDQPTTVTTPAEGASNLTEQQRELIQLVVQPGSVIGENGQVLDNAKVGIATVPPELVRDMLPPGLLQHTFDLTIQAPGAAVCQPTAKTEPALHLKNC
jgi:hypothetical protein